MTTEQVSLQVIDIGVLNGRANFEEVELGRVSVPRDTVVNLEKVTVSLAHRLQDTSTSSLIMMWVEPLPLVSLSSTTQLQNLATKKLPWSVLSGIQTFATVANIQVLASKIDKEYKLEGEQTSGRGHQRDERGWALMIMMIEGAVPTVDVTITLDYSVRWTGRSTKTRWDLNEMMEHQYDGL